MTVDIKEIVENADKVLDPAYHPYLLANKTSPAIKEHIKKDQRVILPIGSTEQHGNDAIVGVDHLTATGIAYAVSKATGILCAPPLNYGMAQHHKAFAGTMALRPTTYINVIGDLISSLKRHGFNHIIVINGHGGNKGPFVNALAEKEDEFADMDFSFFNWWVMPGLEKEIIEKEFGAKEGYHATPTEISLTMALVPKSMTMPASYSCPQQEVKQENVAWVMPNKFKEYYPDGVMRADYSGATEEIGKRVLEAAVREISEKI